MIIDGVAKSSATIVLIGQDKQVFVLHNTFVDPLNWVHHICVEKWCKRHIYIIMFSNTYLVW